LVQDFHWMPDAILASVLEDLIPLCDYNGDGSRSDLPVEPMRISLR